MATEPGNAGASRAYRAACPNCGAPVEFRSVASASAVCAFCRSTVVRDGEALRRIGQSAELFDDHTPLQLGASGAYQGAAFTLVGRLQYRYAQGTWNEWHVLFDSGKSAWLSEDNGRYVLAFDIPLADTPPAAESLRAGAKLTLGGQAWAVASVTTATLLAAQGELPQAPRLEQSFAVADLRSPRGEVATLDHGSAPGAAPGWSVGRSVALSELALTGLAEARDKTLAARTAECPSCGNTLAIQLSTTQSIACTQCHAVVDVSQGVGGDLRHYAQENGLEPLIPLGSVGQLRLGTPASLPWQVVGYVERCEVDAEEGESASAWREYLLYHRDSGFAFLVDAEDGWSWAVPLTGTPDSVGEVVRHQGVAYRKLYSYTGRVTYVLGEFYWRLARDERTANTDYQGVGAASAKRLNREQTGTGGTQEVVWSAGETLDAETVRQAFRLVPEVTAALRRDALPTASTSAGLLAKLFFWGFIAVVVLMLFRCDDDSSCDDTRASFGEASAEYQNCLANRRSASRTGGGSFGGFSSGGSHK